MKQFNTVAIRMLILLRVLKENKSEDGPALRAMCKILKGESLSEREEEMVEDMLQWMRALGTTNEVVSVHKFAKDLEEGGE